jgi:hypothetical protein
MGFFEAKRLSEEQQSENRKAVFRAAWRLLRTNEERARFMRLGEKMSADRRSKFERMMDEIRGES